MIITELELRNFQCIEDFHENFDGDVFLFTGDNEKGKSTLLKSILALLTGERDAVLRNGAKDGFARCILDGDGQKYEVKLKFTEKNPRGEMTITDPNGMKSKEVGLLKKLLGFVDVDAVDFARMSDTAEGRRKQTEIVKSLLPTETQNRLREIDADIEKSKVFRHDANAVLKAKSAMMQSAKGTLTDEEINDASFGEKIDITAISAKQAESVKNDALIVECKAKIERLSNQKSEIPTKKNAIIESHEKFIAECKKREEDARKRFDEEIARIASEMQSHKDIILADCDKLDATAKEIEPQIAKCEAWMAEHENQPNEDFAKIISDAQNHNAKVDAIAVFRKAESDFNNAQNSVNDLQNDIDALMAEKATIIKEMKLPVDGLSFNDDGLTLNGIPFVDGKISDSQKIEVAFRLAVASNPKVKIFRIARGESLGGARFKSIVDFAKQNDFQGFIEVVKPNQDDLRVERYTEI